MTHDKIRIMNKENKTKKYHFKKLHITVPLELFDVIRNKEMLPKIDEICIDLLEQYFQEAE